jgi:outer membrane protein assembly factor BamB
LCLDGATGEVLWQDNILERYGVQPGEDKGVVWGRSASPLVVDDLLIVPAGGPNGAPCVSLAAFHKDTGELVWEAGDRQVSYASPVLATLCGLRQILSVNEDNVSAHDVNTGKELWSYDWPAGSSSRPNVSQPVPLDEQLVLLSRGYGGGSLLLHVELSDGDEFQVGEVWRSRRLLRTKFTNVVVHEGCICGLSDGILECVDAESGTSWWKAGRYGHGQILGVGDLLLVQAESGEVAVVEATPSELRELGRFAAIEGKTWNNLCLYGRFLLVRNSKEAACYELPLVQSNDSGSITLVRKNDLKHDDQARQVAGLQQP